MNKFNKAIRPIWILGPILVIGLVLSGCRENTDGNQNMQPAGSLSKNEPKPAVRETNLIQNGSFEIGPDPGSFMAYDVGATNIPNWRVTRAQIDYIGGYWHGSEGTRSIDLDGTPSAGGIAQSFATISGQQYIVTFDLAGNPGGPPQIKKLQVNAAGQAVLFSFDISGKSASDMGWEKKTWRFKANSDLTTLEFLSLDDPQSKCGPVIDNVSVVSQ